MACSKNRPSAAQRRNASEKTFLLREFDETLDAFEKDISDPIGGSYVVYLNCRDQLEQGIASLLGFIERGEPAAGQGAAPGATSRGPTAPS